MSILSLPFFADPSASAALGLGDILLRLFCAMIVGTVIGTEREYTHRPAGMRTHILVALGACVVMITGQLLFAQYSAYGSTADPARLSAQVITGVGFLGAGTIMREGSTVKGLTTAASLWAVACLGVAAGGGYYAVAIAGMVFILITLTVFETIQSHLVHTQGMSRSYHLVADDITAGLRAVSEQAASCRASVRNLLADKLDDGTYRITFDAEFDGAKSQKRQQRFFSGLMHATAVRSVKLDDCTNAEAEVG